MNSHELLVALRTAIRAAEWATSVPVFASDSVMVTAYASLEAISQGRGPWCILTPGSAKCDDEQPDIIEQEVQVQIVTSHAYDGRGEAALMGANQVSATDSRGKGLLELEEKLMDTIKLLTEANSVTIVFIAANAAQAKMLPDGDSYFVVRSYLFRAYISTVADA